MPRVRKGAARTQARKRILRAARGYFGVKSKHKYQAENALMRAGVYAFRDRRNRKRKMRNLWITRLTAACRMRGTRYSVFINGLKMAGIVLNRKMLSQIAIEDPKAFDQICEIGVKHARSGKANPALAAAQAAAAANLLAQSGSDGQGGHGGHGVATATKSKAKASATIEGDIEAIEGIGPKFAMALRAHGVSWIKELRVAGRTKAGRTELASKTGIQESKILTWVNAADLLRIDGVTPDWAELLEASGVDTVKELAHRVPANLVAKLEEVNKAKHLATGGAPSEAIVAKWVESAKTMPAGVEH